MSMTRNSTPAELFRSPSSVNLLFYGTNMLEKEITFDRFIRGLIAVAIVGLALYILNRLSNVLLPFFIAWFFAYMIYPAVKFFQYRLHLKSRLLAIVVTLLLFLGCLTGVLYLIIPPIVAEFMKFREVTGEFIRQNGGAGIAVAVETFLQQHIDENAIMQLLHEKNIVEALKVAINQLWNLLSQTVDIIFALVGFCIVLLYLFFILIDYEELSNGWIKLVPKGSRRIATRLVDDVQRGMNSYFRGQALVAFLVGILFSIGFVIIDFPLAIGLGLFIGLLNLVPYLQAVGFIPTILLAILKANDTGESFWLILLSACIVFIVVQSIQDAFLVPKIMGKIMGLNPAVILLALSVWGSLMGIIGLIIALPLTTLILSYYRQFIALDERRQERLKRRKHRQSKDEEAAQALAPAPAAAAPEAMEATEGTENSTGNAKKV